MPMVTKLGRMVTYLEGLLPIIFKRPFGCVVLHSDVQTEAIIPPLSHCLLSQNFAGW